MRRVSWHLSSITNTTDWQHWLIYGSEASFMFSKHAQKFIHFEFVFSSSSSSGRACLCASCVGGGSEREKKTQRRNVPWCCAHTLDYLLPEEQEKNSKLLLIHFFFPLDVTCGCEGGTMSQVFSWKRSTAWPWSCPASKVIHKQLQMWFIRASLLNNDERQL